MTRATRVATAAIAIALALAVGIPAATAATADEAAQRDGFPVNARGETYGSDLDATSPEHGPDLIQAAGEDGTEGYVRADDLDPQLPDPAALAEDPAAFAMTDQVIPLYAADGVTVIGTFVSHAGVVTTTPLPGR